MRADDERTLAIEFDEDGLLKDPSCWNEDVAREIARLEGIGPLNAEHWEVIRALRTYYLKFGVAPFMGHLGHENGKPRGWVHDLFHTCLVAWRVAGLPNPGEEAKSYMSDM